ncbi:hypothetical protein, partial [Deinococcus cellulosilyticus]|uniref:hypothetical protein n=1 Tax=Deinococcus cellulosilyticus TaxID=401558 RepID=UPI001C993DE1
ERPFLYDCQLWSLDPHVDPHHLAGLPKQGHGIKCSDIQGLDDHLATFVSPADDAHFHHIFNEIYHLSVSTAVVSDHGVQRIEIDICRNRETKQTIYVDWHVKTSLLKQKSCST